MEFTFEFEYEFEFEFESELESELACELGFGPCLPLIYSPYNSPFPQGSKSWGSKSSLSDQESIPTGVLFAPETLIGGTLGGHPRDRPQAPRRYTEKDHLEELVNNHHVVRDRFGSIRCHSPSPLKLPPLIP